MNKLNPAKHSSLRLPIAMNSRLEAFSRSSGLSRSKLIIEGLELRLGTPKNEEGKDSLTQVQIFKVVNDLHNKFEEAIAKQQLSEAPIAQVSAKRTPYFICGNQEIATLIRQNYPYFYACIMPMGKHAHATQIEQFIAGGMEHNLHFVVIDNHSFIIMSLAQKLPDCLVIGLPIDSSSEAKLSQIKSALEALK